MRIIRNAFSPSGLLMRSLVDHIQRLEKYRDWKTPWNLLDVSFDEIVSLLFVESKGSRQSESFVKFANSLSFAVVLFPVTFLQHT